MTHRPASHALPAALGGFVLLLGVLVGCAPAGSTATATTVATGPAGVIPSTGAPSFATSPTPVVPATSAPGTSAPRPSGAFGWPTAFDVELQPGRYFSAPPFRVPFTLEVHEPGWFSGHLHEDFFDLLRFDGVDHDGLPTRMLAFADPGHIVGPSGNVPVEELSPSQAVELMGGVDQVTASDGEDVEVLGLEGVRVDIRADVPDTHLFGGTDGEFGAGPDQPFRMAVLAREDRLFLVLVLVTDKGDLDAAWEQAEGILETVDFTP